MFRYKRVVRERFSPPWISCCYTINLLETLTHRESIINIYSGGQRSFNIALYEPAAADRLCFYYAASFDDGGVETLPKVSSEQNTRLQPLCIIIIIIIIIILCIVYRMIHKAFSI